MEFVITVNAHFLWNFGGERYEYFKYYFIDYWYSQFDYGDIMEKR